MIALAMLVLAGVFTAATLYRRKFLNMVLGEIRKGADLLPYPTKTLMGWGRTILNYLDWRTDVKDLQMEKKLFRKLAGSGQGGENPSNDSVPPYWGSGRGPTGSDMDRVPSLPRREDGTVTIDMEPGEDGVWVPRGYRQAGPTVTPPWQEGGAGQGEADGGTPPGSQDIGREGFAGASAGVEEPKGLARAAVGVDAGAAEYVAQGGGPDVPSVGVTGIEVRPDAGFPYIPPSGPHPASEPGAVGFGEARGVPPRVQNGYEGGRAVREAAPRVQSRVPGRTASLDRAVEYGGGTARTARREPYMQHADIGDRGAGNERPLVDRNFSGRPEDANHTTDGKLLGTETPRAEPPAAEKVYPQGTPGTTRPVVTERAEERGDGPRPASQVVPPVAGNGAARVVPVRTGPGRNEGPAVHGADGIHLGGRPTASRSATVGREEAAHRHVSQEVDTGRPASAGVAITDMPKQTSVPSAGHPEVPSGSGGAGRDARKAGGTAGEPPGRGPTAVPRDTRSSGKGA